MLDNNPVWVKWVDSATAGGHEWRSHREVQELSPPMVEIVGYILQETAEYITMVACRDLDPNVKDREYWGEMTIPTGAILEIRELKFGKLRKISKRKPK